MINIYILSIATADLICGLFVVPLSVYPAMVQRWIYGDIICMLAGYVEVCCDSIHKSLHLPTSKGILTFSYDCFPTGYTLGCNSFFIYVDERG